MSTTAVKVIVLEDDVEVGVLEVVYYDEQPYMIKIDTPDGVDRLLARKVGEPAA